MSPDVARPMTGAARETTASELDAPLHKRLGPVAKHLEKYFGITTVGELLNHFPRTYLKRGELTPIADVPVDEEVTLIARVQSATSRRMKVVWSVI